MMADTISTKEPARLRAGETLSFSKTLANYPAPTWSLLYTFRSLEQNSVSFSFTSTASGVEHLVTVAYGTTDTWQPANYIGQAYATDGTSRFSVWSGELLVLPNLSRDTDPRTTAKRTLDNIVAVIEGRASSSILESDVEGTRLKRIPVDDLLKLRDRYEVIVANEVSTERAAFGLVSNRIIKAQFTRQ